MKVMIRLCSLAATRRLTQGDRFEIVDVQAKFCHAQAGEW